MELFRVSSRVDTALCRLKCGKGTSNLLFAFSITISAHCQAQLCLSAVLLAFSTSFKLIVRN